MFVIVKFDDIWSLQTLSAFKISKNSRWRQFAILKTVLCSVYGLTDRHI